MLGKKLVSACTAAVFSALLAMAVVMTTSFTPTLADGPAFCPDDSKSDDGSGSKASNRECSGLMDTIPVCGQLGNAFETHRDCVEDFSQADWDAAGCGSCHSLDRPVPGEFAPSCQTCHGKKWDFGDDDKSGDDKSGDRMVNHPFPFGNPWTDPEKQHRDYAEDVGVAECVGCHEFQSRDRNPFTGAPGCAYCHSADKVCDARDAGDVPGTEFCEDDKS